jgi:hypothetical protein
VGLLAEFRMLHRDRIASEAENFSSWPLEKVIEQVAKCKRVDETHHPHLHRIPRRARRAVEREMLARIDVLRAADSFERLHQALTRIAAGIRGLGVVWTYDAALAIGALRGLRPECIYLHAGTAEDARLFGIRGAAWPASTWPREFLGSGMSADDFESFLCGYKNRLKPLKDRGKLPNCAPGLS